MPGTCSRAACDLRGLTAHLVAGQRAGRGAALGVVGDGEVLVSELPGGRHHLLDRIAAVAPTGVRVQIAAHVQRREQLGEPVLLGRFDLVAAFAQLRRHVGQSQVAVQVVLGRARHVPARVGQRALIEHQPAAPGARLQTLHVRIRAGVPGQRRAGFIGRGDEHFDGAAVGDHRDAGGRTAEHRRPSRQVLPARRTRRHVGPRAPWPAAPRDRSTARSGAGFRRVSADRSAPRFVERPRRRTTRACGHARAKSLRMAATVAAILSRFVGPVYDGGRSRRVGEATMRRCAGGARTNPSHWGATAALH